MHVHFRDPGQEQKEDIAVKLMGMTLREKRTFYRVMDREHPEFFSDEDDDDCCGCGDCKKGGSHGKKCAGGHGHDHCHCHDGAKGTHDHEHCESSDEDEVGEPDGDDGFDDLDDCSDNDDE